MELDILTSRPKMPSNLNESQRKEGERLEKDVVRGVEVEQKLISEEGKFFIEMIEKSLEIIIDKFVQDNPQTQVLLGLLEGLGNQVMAGKAASRRLAETRLRRG